MREIKFRGQKLDSKEFVYGQLAYMFDDKNYALIMPSCYYATRDFDEEDENGNPIIQNDLAIGGFLYVKSETVGQFTGLCDKNGKEIYEGDILLFEYNKTPHVVGYEQNSFILKLIDNRISCYNWNGSCLEIIGNIYENPELLIK